MNAPHFVKHAGVAQTREASEPGPGVRSSARKGSFPERQSLAAPLTGKPAGAFFSHVTCDATPAFAFPGMNAPPLVRLQFSSARANTDSRLQSGLIES